MTEQHRIASVDEFESDGSRVIAEVMGQEIAVFRIDGEFHAVANFCVHQAGPLCEGELSGHMEVDEDWEWQYNGEQRFVTCPWHGWKFDVVGGENVNDPRYKVPKYDVSVEDGDVFISQ